MECGKDLQGTVKGWNVKSKFILWSILLIFAVSVLMSFFVLRPSGKHLVEIVQEDTVLYTIDLDRAENQELIVCYGESSNTIRIENGEIWVAAAECPDHTCMKMGKLHSESLPIVCLPNRLIIRFAE